MAEAVHEPNPSGSPWRAALGGCLAMALALGIGRFLLTPLLPPMMEALGLGADQAGLIASANYLGYLMGAILGATRLLERRRELWLFGAISVSVLTTALMGASGSLLWLSLDRLIAGVASALVLVIASSTVVEAITRSARQELGALHFAGVGLGISSSAMLVSLTGAISISWAGQWFAGGLLAFVLAVSALALMPKPSSAPARPRTANGLELDRPLVTLALVYGCFGYGYIITATFIVTIARASLDSTTAENVVWLLVGMTAIPSVAVWTWIARRIGALRAYAVACLALATGVAASVVVGGIVGLTLAALLLGGTFMGLTALGVMAARNMRPDATIRAIALVTAAFGLGQMIGPTVAGFLAEWTGSFLWPSLTASAVLVFAAILSTTIDERSV